MPRAAESWLNEYRGRRNDGRVTNESHLEFIRLIQQDAAAGEREALLDRLIGAAGDNHVPAWILRALTAPAAVPTPPPAVAAPTVVPRLARPR